MRQVYEEQLAVGAQRTPHGSEHFSRAIEVMVDVARKDQVDRCRRIPIPVSVPMTLSTLSRFSRAARSAMKELNFSTTSSE
jgi:hypothetical protein